MKRKIARITATLLLGIACTAHAGNNLQDSVIVRQDSVFHLQDSVPVIKTDTARLEALSKDSAKQEALADYCAICEKHVHEIVYAPYYTEFKRQWPFLIASASIYAAGFILTAANPLEPLSEEEIASLDRNNINSFDRPATSNWSTTAGTASDYVLLGMTVLPVVFLSEHHLKSDIIPLAIMAAEAYLFNYGVTTICKNLAKRVRPYAYNPEVPHEEKTGADTRESFFSGHTSQTAAATFLFANVIKDYHPNMRPGLKRAMWIFAATVPAVEGYLRVQAGKHFPTDVITGYIIGATSGWLIPRLHRYQKTRYKYEIGFLPSREGMMMSFNFRF